jgi:hypothetical protein
MKAMRVLGAVAALALAAGAAWAGGCCGGGGFCCQNKCPLAQKASQCRAYGSECDADRQAIADVVLKNIAKI